MPQRQRHRVIGAKTAARDPDLVVPCQVLDQRYRLVQHVVFEVQMTLNPVPRVDLLAIPAFAVDRGQAEQPQSAMFELVGQRAIMPRSSYSKNAPIEVGKTITGGPAWPNMSSSMSRFNERENHL